MNFSLRITEEHHSQLRSHLFPGENKEAVALLLCGRRIGEHQHVLTVQQIILVPHASCSVRAPDRVTWPTSYVDSVVSEAYCKKNAIVKIHSHGEGYRFFSETDDYADRELFSSVSSLLDDGLPHASLIMFPSGEMFGRALDENGTFLDPISSIMVVGSDLVFWNDSNEQELRPSQERHLQAFGSGTISSLGRLSVAVVGCSGTGSIVIEQLARLGVQRFVLVDPDVVEEKNLNRILNTGIADIGKPKVEVIAAAISRLGFNQEVLPIATNLAAAAAVLAVAECDVVFGCVDSLEGRHLLNRIATFYLIPYFDVGVRLDADGKGGINGIAGAVHYLQPGCSSLYSREVYSLKQVEAEEMKRVNPTMYEDQRKQGYLRGVNEDRPAVISVNMFFAALMVNEFLARLHPYRNAPNQDYAYIPGNLSEVSLLPEAETGTCSLLKRHVGRGDTMLLLDRTGL